jgi:hypothetical protein
LGWLILLLGLVHFFVAWTVAHTSCSFDVFVCCACVCLCLSASVCLSVCLSVWNAVCVAMDVWAGFANAIHSLAGCCCLHLTCYIVIFVLDSCGTPFFASLCHQCTVFFSCFNMLITTMLIMTCMSLRYVQHCNCVLTSIALLCSMVLQSYTRCRSCWWHCGGWDFVWISEGGGKGSSWSFGRGGVRWGHWCNDIMCLEQCVWDSRWLHFCHCVVQLLLTCKCECFVDLELACSWISVF